MSGKHLSVVAIAAKAMAGHKELRTEAGMDGYLIKPLFGEGTLLYDRICGGQFGSLERKHHCGLLVSSLSPVRFLSVERN